MCNEDSCPVAYGTCHCGCGRKTSVPTRTDPTKRAIKGVPKRYVNFHWNPNPDAGRPLADRLWEKIDRKVSLIACWPWTGSKDSNGYGQIRDGKVKKSHRVVWELTKGPLPKGKNPMHKCDNPACNRPSHLTLGTQQENIKDCQSKGRFRIGGGKNGVGKYTRTPDTVKYGAPKRFTSEQAQEAYARRMAGTPYKVLEHDYGVCNETLRRAFKRISLRCE